MSTRRDEQVDDYHGELVTDPFRWLEDTNDADTASWIKTQNETTEAWLTAVPTREEIRSRLSELWDYARVGLPFERGGRWFQQRNSGLQNQSVLCVMDDPGDEGRVLLDPNELSEEGTVAVPAAVVTDDGELLAYATSEAGSDWMTWHVREVASGVERSDLVEWSKYSVAAWRKDGSGFYYTVLDRPTPGAEYLEKTPPRRIAFHRIGTPQEDDEIVFETPEHPEWGSSAEVSDNGRFVVISVSEGTAPENQLHVIDLENPERGVLPLLPDFACKAYYVTNVGDTFYLLTNDSAERQRLVAVELSRPERQYWREIVPETGDLLLAARHCGGRLVCHHLENACSRLSVVDLEGAALYDIPLPPICSLVDDHEESGIEGRSDSPVLHFAVTSFTDSGSLFRHDLDSGETQLVQPGTARVDPHELVSEQVFVRADDGASIPLFLTRRRDTEMNGDVPVLLYGYGGFDISITPSFSVRNAVFVERGGLLAVASLRGGGEYGRSWHEAGSRQNKQRVFDDFCDCARWLASSGWSRPDRIAINGGSNGGLLVGACMTQHPELFGAAVPDVGVLDMLRFHKFTIGWAWKSDFGDPDDAEQYRWVRAYSPLHNIEPGRNYPPTLITTGDHDDRVIPGHSFKFAATLQAAQEKIPESERAPVLVRIETAAGHGHGMPTSKAIGKATDDLAFIEAALGTTG